jgi:2-dehydro-3-deoxyphosphogalactonate aldolase
MSEFHERLAALPLIAILRGLVPEDAVAIGEALVEAGFGVLEVPLNSPRPFESITALARRFQGKALVGAGTVLAAAAVARVKDAGGGLIVLPHGDLAIVAAAKRHGLVAIPGVATPTEGMAACAAGADALKLFPAEALPPEVVKAWRAVFAPETLFIPVGGITPERLAPYWAAGASGFGIGSALFKPGLKPAEVAARAKRFADAMRTVLEPHARTIPA